MKTRISHSAPEVIDAVNRIPASVLKKVSKSLDRGSHEVAREAKSLVPLAFSTLINAIQVQSVSELVRDVVAKTDYALAVEKGTGPGGLPPVQSIEDWMKVKGIEGDAFLIARSIAQKGTKAQPFFEPALKAKSKRILDLVYQAASRGLSGASR